MLQNRAGDAMNFCVRSILLSMLTTLIVASSGHGYYSFRPARRDYIVGVVPINTKTLDFNLDGFTDMAVLRGWLNGTLTILEGSPSGEFESVWEMPCGEFPKNLSVMDVNRDGFPDIVVTIAGESVLRTFCGDGTGVFTQEESYYAGIFPVDLQLNDLEGDGEDEVFVTSGSTLFIFKHAAEGGLVNYNQYPIIDSSSDFKTGDINGDGFMDVVLAYQREGVQVYFGDGSGEISSGIILDDKIGNNHLPMKILVEDINLDGFDDILTYHSTAGRADILWGDSQGSFTRTTITYDISLPVTFETGPEGGGGFLDLLLINQYAGSVQVLEGGICGVITKGPIPETMPPPAGMKEPRGNSVVCFTEKEPPYQCGQITVWAAVNDVNNDAYPDLLVLNRGSGTLSVFLGDEDGSYLRAPNFKTGPGDPGTKSVVVLDANEDGYDDVAVGFRRVDEVSILLGDGQGNLIYHGSFPYDGHGTSTLATGDFNEDGHEDIVVRNVRSASVSVLVGDGTGEFESVGEFFTDVGTHLVTVVDINQDTHLDVITPNSRGGSITILLGDGTGSLQPFVDIPVGLGPHSSVVIDFNRDGFPDLATANMYEDSVAILQNESGMLTLIEKIPVARYPISLCTGDFDEDGYDDLAVANIMGLTIGVLFGTGTSSFQPLEPDLVAGRGPHFVVSADLDRDGHLDLISPITGSDDVVVYVRGGGWKLHER